MDLQSILAKVLSGVFILLLYLFIVRALRYMIRDSRLEKEREENLDLPQWGLEILQPGSATGLKKGSIIPLTTDFTVGRAPSNTLQLPEVHVSGKHMHFYLHKGRFVAEDVGSKNGTYLNRQRLEQKTYLRVGDIISVGSTSFRIIG